jgi:hypothetical protein
MPDLRTEAVVRWLDAVRPAQFVDAWPPPVRAVETSSQATGLLVEFGLLLDQLTEQNGADLSAALLDPLVMDDLRLVLSQLGAARALAYFHWLRDNGLSGHLDMEAGLLEERSPASRALFATVTTIARQATLRRLISMERMDELVSATDTANKEPTNV